jgi:beta-glucuronidase
MFYEGTVWYKRAFAYRHREHTRTFVHFSAVATHATVYLNGTKIGEHEGAYTPFDIEVTGKLRDGDNTLIVAANNRRSKDAVPALNTDWWNYGGITRDVQLVEVPESFIQDYSVQLTKGSSDEIAGWVQLNGAAAATQVTIEIPDANLRQTATTDDKGLATFRFPAKLDKWSPTSPKLYKVTVATASDSVSDNIGFRTIETRGHQVLLNGKPIWLRGISVHEEAPYRGGRAFSADDDRTLLQWAKDLGCNFVRLAHYPHNEGMTRLADSMGLMVWSEIPVYWDTDWTNPATYANAEAQLRANIARDHNRASVVLWSVSNETPIKPERTEFLARLIATARQLDSTRLLTSAMNRTSNSGATRTIDDPLGASLDVIGLNEYLGWYEGKPEDAATLEWKLAWDKPLVVSEFGGGAPYGNHGAREVRWTEEYQQWVFETQIAMLRKIPQLAGMSPWLLMDFRSPRRLIPGVQDYHNRKGLLSDRGEKKKAFYTLQDFYREMKAQEAGK